MRFGSLFSGIGGIDLGLERSGMECAWQVEIDPYRRAVLTRHWPDVRRYEDVRECQGVLVAGQHGRHRDGRRKSSAGNDENACYLEPVDLICGGFPCQDVSTAGKRAGLQAPRSGLFFEFARIVGELRPKWLLVENVPGLYSSNAGKDFDTVIGTLAELGYGLAWRVLDSQYFGVPQRRRRVFIVGYLGGPCPPAVLFEREGGEGDSQESGKAGAGITHALTSSPSSSGRYDPSGETYCIEDVAGKQSGGPEVGKGYREGAAYTLQRGHQQGVAFPLEAADGHHGRSSPRGDGADNLLVCEENTRDEMRIRGSHPHVSARWGGKQKPWLVWGGSKRKDRPEGGFYAEETETARPIDTSGAGDSKAQGGTYVSSPANPDGMRETTGLPRRLDGRRYAALGDAVTVNVAEWIGKRIMAVDRCTP